MSFFKRIHTNLKMKHEVLDCSFEILEWWWSRWCVDCYSLRVNVGTWWLLVELVLGGAIHSPLL